MARVSVASSSIYQSFLRKRIFLAGCIFLVVLLSGCKTLEDAQKQAMLLEYDLHFQMEAGDLAGIYNNADPEYQLAVTREKSDALFAAIARKLGSPTDCKPGGFNISATTSGTVIRSVCTTTFSKNATGTETFVWRKSGDRYRLLGYHINSDELLER